MIRHASITRQKSGRGFAYYQNGRLITNKAALYYLRRLAIPSNWRDVLISPFSADRILARGTDSDGRQQAIYHPDHRPSLAT